MRALGAILLLIMLTACVPPGPIFADNPLWKPRPSGMGGPPEHAPQEYRMGWDDGCETGLSTMSTGFYKSFYKYKQSDELANNAMYYKAWKDAYKYCRQYAFKYVWQPFDSIEGKSGPLCVLCPNEVDRAQ